ncbi:MAG: LexA family transcriptional regulator [Candidatus Omnitrophota bacterium]|nr:translesion error-prone DNA polymerase V autoproteolytic subunit [Candidatus Omnitrophota bacterium]MBU1929045.1 translesion error-prone DNA polymerase V autoproteolytic subunit [Candidatus Omnitrophota bacterium]MBU2034386.1 translesion error-prone DNA polymerase V autoproteolytic subunit [Candidatus Omnitrophota bacterium]MBU2221475.1 translesion error-prone DNA polymerase V autoproteolytic subunit [Candidatus Omnitrophota bacterium]MBU2258550.1 translesion error-prone DNA polymerase V aut
MDRNNLKEQTVRLEEFYLKNKRMPSYSEMLKVFRFRSKNAVFKKVNQLVKLGLFAKDKTGRLIPAGVQRPVRLLGFIQAGFPSPAEEETVDLMSLDEYLISNPQATYLLKVSGDSMLDAGIHPGDLVLVQKDLTPKNGDIVVACVDKEWTLKYFEKLKGKVRLRAANKKYLPIEPKEELVIAGVVIANVRKYK